VRRSRRTGAGENRSVNVPVGTLIGQIGQDERRLCYQFTNN